jgi:hypothetical protein
MRIPPLLAHLTQKLIIIYFYSEETLFLLIVVTPNKQTSDTLYPIQTNLSLSLHGNCKYVIDLFYNFAVPDR